MLHDVTDDQEGTSKHTSASVRERLIGRNMHIGHRRDSRGLHVTGGRGIYSEAFQRVANAIGFSPT